MGRLLEILLVTTLGVIFVFLIYSISFETNPPLQQIETTDYFVCGKIISYSENGDEIYLSFNGFEGFDFNEVRQIQGVYIKDVISANEVIVFIKPMFNQKLKLAELFDYFEKQYCAD